MEIDVMARHIPALLEFKKRIEALMEGGEGTAAEALAGQIDDVRKDLSDLAEHVAAVEQFKDDASQKVTLLVSFKDELQPILEGIAGLRDMANWFADNRAGLEMLLSIGDGLKTEAHEPASAAPLTLDQLDATTKPQIKDVEVPEALSDTVESGTDASAIVTGASTEAASS